MVDVEVFFVDHILGGSNLYSFWFYSALWYVLLVVNTYFVTSDSSKNRQIGHKDVPKLPLRNAPTRGVVLLLCILVAKGRFILFRLKYLEKKMTCSFLAGEFARVGAG